MQKGSMKQQSIIVYPTGQGPDVTSHWFYNHTIQLLFDKESWTYFRVEKDGSLVPLDGVTHTCHILDKSAPLMIWAVRKAMAKLKKRLDGRGV